MDPKKKIKRIINTANELIKSGATISDPKFKAWKTSTLSFLEEQYGKGSAKYLGFKTNMFDSPRAAGFDGDNVILLDEMKTTILEFQEYLAEIEDTLQQSNTKKESNVTDKTKIFIGSSTNGLSRAKSLKEIIETKSGGKIEATVWNEKRLFKLSYATIDSLINIADDLKNNEGYAVLLFTPDDEVTMNKGKVGKETTQMCPRDNVVFEMGLFMGKLGRDHVICVRPENIDLRILSDWKGMTDSLYRYQTRYITKSMNRPAEEIVDAVMGAIILS